jgi:hypothetical protein
MIGKMVHVRDASPSGWIGMVRAQTGTTLTIVTATGAWKLIDMTRREVRLM